MWFKTKQIKKINIKWRGIWQLNKGKKRNVVMTPGLFPSQECLISWGTQCCRDDIHKLFSHVEFAPLLCETVHVPTILNYIYTVYICVDILHCCPGIGNNNKLFLHDSWCGIFPAGGMYMKLYYSVKNPCSLHRSGTTFSRGSALEFNAIINK